MLRAVSLASVAACLRAGGGGAGKRRKARSRATESGAGGDPRCTQRGGKAKRAKSA